MARCVVEGSIHTSDIDWENIPYHCPLCGRILEWFAWGNDTLEYPSLVCWGSRPRWARFRQRLTVAPEAVYAHYRFAFPGRRPDITVERRFDARTGTRL